MKTTTNKIVYTGLFAALITVSIYLFHIPAGNGFIHLGDALIYLASIILPFPYGIAAAAIGGSLSDLVSGYPIYIIPTFIIKALNSSVFYIAKSRKSKIISARSVIAAAISSVITILGYYLTAVILFGGFVVQLPNIIENSIQACGSFFTFVAIGLAFDKSSITNRIKLYK